MPKTRTDLINEALDLLGVVGAGQTPAAEDRAVIDGKIEPKLAELARREIVYVPDADTVDDEIFDALATLLAEEAGPKFGRPRDLGVRLEAEGRLIAMQGGAGLETVRADYF
jgi:hypothetical protein